MQYPNPARNLTKENPLMSHTYHQLYFHFIWGTYLRKEIIDRKWRAQFLSLMAEEVRKHGGHTIRYNAMPDHVHLLVRLPPRIAPATFIGRVKGGTSYRVNRESHPEPSLSWQEGYGAITLRKDELEKVSRYIDKQEEHHAANRLSRLLERVSEGEESPTGDSSRIYRQAPPAFPDSPGGEPPGCE